MIVYTEDELSNVNANIIVNRLGVYTTLDHNFSKKIYNKYPDSYAKFIKLVKGSNYSKDLIGSYYLIKIDSEKWICNLITHSSDKDNYSSDIDFNILENTIKELHNLCIKNNLSIAFPYNFKFRNNSKAINKFIDLIYKYFLESSIECYLVISKHSLRAYSYSKKHKKEVGNK